MNGYTLINIYKDCKIQPNKNFRVDNIESYLATLTRYNNLPMECQLMKHSLKHTYKLMLVNINESYGNNDGQGFLTFDSLYNYNYLVAQNFNTSSSGDWEYSSTKVYYFIVGKKWKGQSAVELELEMDVINTLIGNEWNNIGHLELSDKTTILRQHKNRWKNGTSPELKFPIIDLYTEGIPATLFKKKEGTLLASYNDGLDISTWYLIYRSTGATNNPIDVLLCADVPLTFRVTERGYSGTRNAYKDLGGSKYVALIYGSDTLNGTSNVGARITFNDKNNEEHIITLGANDIVMYDGGFVYVGYVDVDGIHQTQYFEFSRKIAKKLITLQNIGVMRIDLQSNVIGHYSDYTPTYIGDLGYAKLDYSGQTISTTIGTIEEIKRTDPLLLKIIKLPYCPISLDLSIESYTALPNGWKIENNIANYPPLLRYTSESETNCFQNYLTLLIEDEEVGSPFDVFKQRALEEYGDLVPRNKEYETKLLHSDYFRQKFVYDSFAFEFNGEFLSEIDGGMNFEVIMAVSSAMSSRFLFEFPQYKLLAKVDNQDYTGLLQIVRNNEVPLYNSEYLNYIRSGYNYDIKTKNRQLTTNIISGVVQTAGAVVSAVAGGTFGIPGAIALGVSAFTKFTSTIVSNVQAEQNIAQRLKQAEMQGVSVAGADDVDLLSYYTEWTKAKMVKYYVSDKMEEILFDLFHYYGYIAGFQGIPDVTSRMWFNFVQAQPVFTNMQNFPQELVDELTKKYSDGITFLHRQGWQGAYLWDFEQANENWESGLRHKQLQVGLQTSVIANREYVLDPNIAQLHYQNANIVRIGKMTFRIRQKSNMMTVEEIHECDGISLNSVDGEIKVLKNLATIKTISINDYDQQNFYWTFEFSVAIPSPTSSELEMLSYCIGYLVD